MAAKHKPLNKKAQVETQFNWIFVIAIGAVIILFFTGVVMKQKSSSDTKISETVMTDLQSIFTGGSVSTGTSQLIETPKIEINFDCATYDLKGVTKPAENLIIFAPTKLKGRNIITWTLDFSLPYKITNLLYLTTPEMRYIFVGDKKWLAQMNSTLPKEINAEYIEEYDPQKIEDKNNYKVRMIFNGNIKSIPQKLAGMKKDLTALVIKTDGSLEFYESDGSNFIPQQGPEKTYTIDRNQMLKPTLYGAIFTDSIELYNCMIGKALKRAYFVSIVYSERNKNITTHFETTKSYCDLYKYGQDRFTTYLTSIEQQYPSFRENPQTLTNIESLAEGMAGQNKILLQKSCPLIY